MPTFMKLSMMICMLLVSALIHATTKQDALSLGVELAPQIKLEKTNETLFLNGYAIREMWGEKIYVAALYTKSIEHRGLMLLMNDQPAQMQFYFVRDDISPPHLSKSFIESILMNNGGWKNSQLDKNRLVELEEKLNLTFNAGDTLTFAYLPQTGVQLLINNQEVYYWPHAKAFFNMLLRMWIGPYPPSRDFKAEILGVPKSQRGK